MSALVAKRRRRNGTPPSPASEAEVEQIARELEAVSEWERRQQRAGVYCAYGCTPGCEHVRYLVEQLEAKR